MTAATAPAGTARGSQSSAIPLSGAGRLLRYEPSDEPDGTVVTIAAMVWP